MKGDDLPATDHVVRHIKKIGIEEDGTANGAAFLLRPDEIGLSVNWLEAFDLDKANQLARVRRLFRLQVRKSHRFAELNIGAVSEKVAEELRTLRIAHDPLDPENGFEADPSHAEITGLPPGDSDQAMMIGDMIATCVSAMHPVTVEA